MVILVRNKGLPQLDQDHMWLSWYDIRACLNSMRVDDGPVVREPEAFVSWGGLRGRVDLCHIACALEFLLDRGASLNFCV